MSAFARLCKRAGQLGAKRLIFTTDVFDDGEDTPICGDWTCIGGDRYGTRTVGIAHGLTGEEALKNLVAKLEEAA